MKYIKKENIKSYINNRTYASIDITGSIIGMKKLFNWNTAQEIIRSGSCYYAIW